MSCATGTRKLFFYDIEDFFDLSSIETMYRSDAIENQTGVSVLDRYSLTNNDRKFFDKLLKRGASEAYKIIQPLCRDIDNAFNYNSNPSYTVAELNALETPSDYTNLLIIMEDAGTLTLGSLAVIIGTKVYFDGTEWVNGDALTTKYILYDAYFPKKTNLLTGVSVSTYDLNNVTPLDEKLSEFISIYVVREWFRRYGFRMDEIELEYQRLEIELKRLVNYRKEYTRVSRTF